MKPKAMETAAGEKRVAAPVRSGLRGLVLKPKMLEAFLEGLARQGRSPGTLATYRHCIEQLYNFLPPNRTVLPDTLEQWREELLAGGYAPRSVNVRLSAANCLMDFLGRGDLRSREMLRTEETEKPRLTRAEYLRLLSAARARGKERLYLLIKLFGSTGLSVGGLSALTVESLMGREPCPVRMPDFLRRELLDYSARLGLTGGPLFRTRNGKPLNRTSVTDSMKQLCQDACVAEEKVNPRCLSQMWQATRDGMRTQMELLLEQACESLLETEELAIGWESNGGAAAAPAAGDRPDSQLY